MWNLKYCNNINIIPNRTKEEIIPKAVIKKLILMLFWSVEKTDINFIDRTGNTHGMAFKIKPASNDTNI